MFVCKVTFKGWLWLSLVSAHRPLSSKSKSVNSLNAALGFCCLCPVSSCISSRSTFYPLSSGSKPDANQTNKDEVNSSKLGAFLVPGQSGVGCQFGRGRWGGSERASRYLYVQLTPASLNRWTSRERLPPLLSNRSSVSFSLCRQEEKLTGSGERVTSC